MKRHIITSESFTGEVHIIYNDEGQLMATDYQHAQLRPEQTDWIQKRTPAIYAASTFQEGFESTKLRFAVEGYEITFEMFYNKYAQKRNGPRAEQIWNRLSRADKARAYFSLNAYDRHLQINNWKNKKEVDTYLRQRAWENDWK